MIEQTKRKKMEDLGNVAWEMDIEEVTVKAKNKDKLSWGGSFILISVHWSTGVMVAKPAA